MPFFSWKKPSSDTSSKDTTTKVESEAAKLNRLTESEISPFASSNVEKQHNHGRAIIEDLDKDGKQRTKFTTDCGVQHRASLACIEEHYTDKEAHCQTFFDQYKACRREERERKLAQNKGRSFFG
eukprot:CAMPEP_0194165470 /NCGR_PEP_ID=MMETSP0154-20130528/1370_1 /TAXON_ID=1049557 /ORGANISM="Thalassiothrix antarctica, Strain L6-D1" /LENGTH=124 /DNA_ID=CAMNT_0038875911 /DNA_START=258 /DNA_END=632 /DNA_ORIENTATION=+